MNLFFLTPDSLNDQQFELRGDEAKHAAKVLRMRTGETVQATDGMGTRYQGVIRSVNSDRVVADMKERVQVPHPQPSVTIALGMIKKRDRLEFALEKCVELGVSHFVLFQAVNSERSRVRMDRLEMIAKGAMKQSLRCWLPELTLCDSLEEVLEACRSDLNLVADETKGAEAEPADSRPLAGSYLIIIGPEGGFSTEERGYLAEQSVSPFSLGHYRLRAETAAIASMCRFLPAP
ncbi:MAG: RsmE family RNA methyltransferase [Balneolaceae bacterium]